MRRQHLFTFFLTVSIFICSHHINAKTVILNIDTGFDQALPFDEYFQIQLTGIQKDSLENLQLVFKELSNKGVGIPKDKCKTDTAYFNSIDTYMSISFDKEGYGVAYRMLHPNKYYLVAIHYVTKAKVSEEEKGKLIDNLTNDSSFKEDIVKTLLKNINENDLGEEAINDQIIAKLKTIDDKYIIVNGKSIIDDTNFNGTVSSLSEVLENLGNLSIAIENREDAIEIRDSINRILSYFSNGADISESLTDLKTTVSQSKLSADSIRSFSSLIDQILGSYDKSRDKLRDVPKDIASKIQSVIENIQIYRRLEFTKPNEAIIEGTANRMNASISQTFGWGYSPRSVSGYVYVGYSLFFRAVNNSVPFRNIPKCERVWAMTGVNLGFTLTDINTNGYGAAEGLISFLSNKALITGVCFRPYHFIKFDLNTLWYSQNDPNPTVNHRRLVVTPMIGISLSLNIVKLFNGQPNSLTTLTSAVQ